MTTGATFQAARSDCSVDSHPVQTIASILIHDEEDLRLNADEDSTYYA